MAIGKANVKKGDLVQVLNGKDRDKRGKVLQVLAGDGLVVVDGINVIKRHTRPTKEMPQGGIIERPAPMPVSKVAVVCPGCDQATRIGHSESGDAKARVCKHCGRIIE